MIRKFIVHFSLTMCLFLNQLGHNHFSVVNDNDIKLIEQAEKVMQLAIEGKDKKDAKKFIKAIKILLKYPKIQPLKSAKHTKVEDNLTFESYNFLDISVLYKYADSYAKLYTGKKKKQISEKLQKLEPEIEQYKNKIRYSEMSPNRISPNNNKLEWAEPFTVDSKGNVPIKINADTGLEIQISIREDSKFRLELKDDSKRKIKLNLKKRFQRIDRNIYSFKIANSETYHLTIKNITSQKRVCQYCQYIKK